MRAAVLGKVREYRWELWLFFGVGVIAYAVAWGTAYEAQSSDSTGFRYTVRFLSGYIAWLVLLGISYRWVSRSGRDLLKLVWQYSLAVVPLGIAHTLTTAWVYGSRYERIGVGEGEVEPVWITLLWWAWFAMTLAVLVCFARRASRNGFDKALILIGVIAFPGVNLLAPIYDSRIGYEIGLLAIKVLLSFIAIRALHSADMGKPVGRVGIGVLFGAAMVAYVSRFVALDIENSLLYGSPILSSFYLWMFYIMPMVVAYGIAIIAAHWIRVRPAKGGLPPQEPVDA